MDNFEPTPEKKFQLRGPMLWNVLTVVALVGVLCVGGYFLSILVNPQSVLNPFKPPVIPTLLEFPTATITPLQPPATWTASPTIQPSATRTEAPTWTPFPTNTPFQLPGQKRTATPVPTKTTWPVIVEKINYLNSTIYHPDASCSWMGIAGQAVDKSNAPVMYLTIHIGGFLNGQKIDYLTLTGTAPDYGQAGFEFKLGDMPVATSGTMWIQILDQSGAPLTDKVYFDTKDSCDKNLVLFRLKQTR
jgi:hypothetical protein